MLFTQDLFSVILGFSFCHRLSLNFIGFSLFQHFSTTKTTFPFSLENSYIWKPSSYTSTSDCLNTTEIISVFPAHCSGFPLVTLIPVYLPCYLIFYIKLRSYQHSLSVEAASSTPSPHPHAEQLSARLFQENTFYHSFQCLPCVTAFNFLILCLFF